MSQACVRLFKAGVLVLTSALLVAISMAQPSAEPFDGTQGGQAPAAAPVTFTKDVAPIFQRSCQQCHQPNSIGPMSLVTYAETRPWARSIRSKVVAGEMPPVPLRPQCRHPAFEG